MAMSRGTREMMTVVMIMMEATVPMVEEARVEQREGKGEDLSLLRARSPLLALTLRVAPGPLIRRPRNVPLRRLQKRRAPVPV